MSDISILTRLVNGYQRNVDISANTLVTASIKVGGSTTNTELTKAILDKLVLIQAAADANGTFDSRYTKIVDLASTTSSSGASLVGVNHTPANYTAASATVEANLAGLDSALATATAGTGKVKNSVADTTSGYLSAKITAGSGVLKSTLNPGANESLSLAVDPTVFVPQSAVGAANGVASLNASGKIPTTQLPNVVMEYQESWNPNTNSPALADGTGTNGFVYRVSTADASAVSGLTDPSMVNFTVGDLVIYSGTLAKWQKAPAVDGVSSVNGAVGAVTVNAINQLTGDIAAGPASGSASAAATIQPGAVTAAKLGSVTDGITLDQSGAGSTLEVKALGISSAQLAPASVTPAKLGTVTDGVTLDQSGSGATLEVKAAGISKNQLATGAFDQATIVGGAGTVASVAQAPKVVRNLTVGFAMAANTSYLVRWGRPGTQSETGGSLYKADNNSSADDLFMVVGIASSTSAVTAGSTVSVTTLGQYALASSDTAFTTAQVGTAIYLGSAGAMLTAPPTAAVGTALVKVGVVQDGGHLDMMIQVISA
jgi:hypothetical protein